MTYEETLARVRRLSEEALRLPPPAEAKKRGTELAAQFIQEVAPRPGEGAPGDGPRYEEGME